MSSGRHFLTFKTFSYEAATPTLLEGQGMYDNPPLHISILSQSLIEAVYFPCPKAHKQKSDYSTWDAGTSSHTFFSITAHTSLIVPICQVQGGRNSRAPLKNHQSHQHEGASKSDKPPDEVQSDSESSSKLLNIQFMFI